MVLVPKGRLERRGRIGCHGMPHFFLWRCGPADGQAAGCAIQWAEVKVKQSDDPRKCNLSDTKFGWKIVFFAFIQ